MNPFSFKALFTSLYALEINWMGKHSHTCSRTLVTVGSQLLGVQAVSQRVLPSVFQLAGIPRSYLFAQEFPSRIKREPISWKTDVRQIEERDGARDLRADIWTALNLVLGRACEMRSNGFVLVTTSRAIRGSGSVGRHLGDSYTLPHHRKNQSRVSCRNLEITFDGVSWGEVISPALKNWLKLGVSLWHSPRANRAEIPLFFPGGGITDRRKSSVIGLLSQAQKGLPERFHIWQSHWEHHIVPRAGHKRERR
jgi:hypothetical protein